MMPEKTKQDPVFAKITDDNSPIQSLNSVVPKELVEVTTRALYKLKDALNDDVSGYVANRLRMNLQELGAALATEQVEGVALASTTLKNGRSRSSSATRPVSVKADKRRL